MAPPAAAGAPTISRSIFMFFRVTFVNMFV